MVAAMPLAERFWRQVSRGEPGECWVWAGNTTRGYGRIFHQGRNIQAQRVAYELELGAIPERHQVTQRCGNRRCCNPDHLRAVLPGNAQSAEERFWSKVSVLDENQCWLWTGKVNNKGYGKISVAGAYRYAHRFSWEIHNDAPIPEGLCVLHRCDTPRCVNPRHLWVGTQLDNIADMLAKGRGDTSGLTTRSPSIGMAREVAAGL